jgi:hypothetical protein
MINLKVEGNRLRVLVCRAKQGGEKRETENIRKEERRQ